MKLLPTNTSGYPGVSWHKAAQKWGAYIRRDGQRRYLGLFDTAEEGFAAYKAAAAQHPSAEKRQKEKRESLLDAVRKLYVLHGYKALSTPYLEKAGLYIRLRNAGLAQSALLAELKLASGYGEWRRLHRPYRGKVQPTWTWEVAVETGKRIKEEQGDLPTLEWCRRNGHSSLANTVFKSGHSWEELREAVGCFATAPYRQSRNGVRWRSQPEASLSNFLYARGIEHRRGQAYSDHDRTHRGRHRYDLHFPDKAGRWIDVEVWGDFPTALGGDRYNRTRAAKEGWREGDDCFLGIEYRDCLSDARLTQILQRYIGIIEPFVFDKPSDPLIQTCFWSNADDLIENCRALALQMPDGIFPTENWLRKRGKYADRSGETLNSMALRVNQWLGGTRNVRRILGHPEASTTDWNRSGVISAWREFSKRYGITASQMMGNCNKALPAAVRREASRLYEAARRLNALNEARGGVSARKVKWTEETATRAWRDFVAAHGRTPSQCMSATRRKMLPREVSDEATRIYYAASKLSLLEKLRME